MKIDGTSINPLGKIQGTNRVTSNDKRLEEVERSGKDGVKVSDKAQAFNTLLQKAMEVPEVRTDLVNEIADKIEKGEFKVDPEVIAWKLLMDYKEE